MIKLILLDLDGTLMSSDHMTVSEENRKALRKAHEAGIKIAICTGRTLSIIGDVCEQVPEIDYVIYSNGAGIYDRHSKSVVHTKLLKWEVCDGIIDYILSKNAFMEIYVSGKSFVQKDRIKYFNDELLPKEFIKSLFDKIEACDDVKGFVCGQDLEKITVYPQNLELENEMWRHFCEMSDKISLASSFPGTMEMTGADVSKGTALESMCEILSLTPAECMCFGDAGNDVPMLKFAEYSFAMANGTEECKAAARYQTKSNAEDGVAWAIYKYALNAD